MWKHLCYIALALYVPCIIIEYRMCTFGIMSAPELPGPMDRSSRRLPQVESRRRPGGINQHRTSFPLEDQGSITWVIYGLRGWATSLPRARTGCVRACELWSLVPGEQPMLESPHPTPVSPTCAEVEIYSERRLVRGVYPT